MPVSGQILALNRRPFGGCGGPGCEGTATNRAGTARTDELDRLRDEALDGRTQDLNPLIEPFERLAASATSYADFAAALDDAAAQGDPAQLVRSLGAALFKARVAGDARDEPI